MGSCLVSTVFRRVRSTQEEQYQQPHPSLRPSLNDIFLEDGTRMSGEEGVKRKEEHTVVFLASVAAFPLSQVVLAAFPHAALWKCCSSWTEYNTRCSTQKCHRVEMKNLINLIRFLFENGKHHHHPFFLSKDAFSSDAGRWSSTPGASD